jgi:hypothetical protein
MVESRAVQDVSFLENVKAYVGFDDAASAALRDAHPIVASHFRAIIDDFYDTTRLIPGASAAITVAAPRAAFLPKPIDFGTLDRIHGGHSKT